MKVAPPKKRKPYVGDEALWDVAATGEAVSDDAIAALARLLVDSAKRRLQVNTEKSAGSRRRRIPDDSLIRGGQEAQCP